MGTAERICFREPVGGANRCEIIRFPPRSGRWRVGRCRPIQRRELAGWRQLGWQRGIGVSPQMGRDFFVCCHRFNWL